MAAPRLALALALASCSASAAAPADAACATDLDCSLNGVCNASSGACACDAPWTGAACAQLAFATTTPASGKSLYNASDVRNTWNGPIVAAGGLFHLFVPLYPKGSLGTPTSTLHGVAAAVTGPYDWASRPQLPLADENPAFVVYVDAATSKTVYSLWLGGMVRVADSVDGPFVPVASYPGGNPAPVFHNGAFYMTNQATLEVYTTPAIVPGAAWTVYANISHDALPPTSPPGQYHVEDASARAARGPSPRARIRCLATTTCSHPRISAALHTRARAPHSPSTAVPLDRQAGPLAHYQSRLQQRRVRQLRRVGCQCALLLSRRQELEFLAAALWSHCESERASRPRPFAAGRPSHHNSSQVSYDDGSEHTYVTLERPNLHFDASGQMTHLNLAADLVTGAEGCASRPDHAHNGRVLRHSPPNPVVRVAHSLLRAARAP